jgi:hypothetical protein
MIDFTSNAVYEAYGKFTLIVIFTYFQEYIHSSKSNSKYYNKLLLLMAAQPSNGPQQLFSFLIICSVVRIPWTGDQPFTRSQPKHRVNTDIHLSSGIRIHDPRV